MVTVAGAASKLSNFASPSICPFSSNVMLLSVPSDGSNFEIETLEDQFVVDSGIASENQMVSAVTGVLAHNAMPAPMNRFLTPLLLVLDFSGGVLYSLPATGSRPTFHSDPRP
jgi:hypothetical protein